MSIFKKKEGPKTPVKDSVLESEKLMYGMGALMQNPGNHAVSKMTFIIYNMVLGLDPRLISLAIFLFRLWDSFTDPFMGNLSDNSRLKWGRRKPYVVLGAILSGLTFPLIWLVPHGWGQGVMFTYLLLSSLIFYTCYTIFSVPYMTMAMEMTPDYHEKTRVVAWRALFSKLSAIGIGWLFFFTQQGTGGTLTGMRRVSIAMAVIFVIFGVLPGLFVKERFFKKAKKQDKVPLMEGLKLTFTTKPFLMIIAMVILMVIGNQMINSLGDYLNVYYLHGGDKKMASVIAGLYGTATMLTAIASIPVFSWLSHRYGKITALKINAFVMLIASISKWWLITPSNPYLMVLNGALQGPGGTGIWMILPSLTADICDWDELRSGRRREGSFSSIFQWVMKLGSSLAFLISGFILAGTGFKAALGGAQAPETLFWMRVFFTAVPTTAMLIILGIVFIYPITEKKSMEIRKELEERRGEM